MFKAIKGVDLYSLSNFPDYKLPEEKGKTFLENASLKARHAAKKLKKWVIADDSGLVVPSLSGKPGVITARYAGAKATDKDNRRKLLTAMEGLSELERAAYFECCLVLASPDGTIKKSVSGICEGLILEQERGNNGFGYDPLFIKHDSMKSFAELDESTKNRISHRSKAFEKILHTIESLVREVEQV